MMASASQHYDIDSSVIDLAILTDGRYDHRGPRKFAAVHTQDLEVNLTPPRPKRLSLMKGLPVPRLMISSIPLLVAIALLVVLLAKAPGLKETMKYDSCTPSGEFVLPGTASIWESKRFFEITILFTTSSGGVCSVIDEVFPQDDGACEGGYTFTQVKAIDMAWDVLVGRGLQALSILVAYTIFSRMIASLMEHGEVGYDMFAAVAFNAGSLSSIITLMRHTIGMTPVPRTGRAILAYLGMMLATIYITCLPSLISAMTGFVPQYSLYFQIGPGNYFNASVVECNGGGLSPVWGRISQNLPYEFTAGMTGQSNEPRS
jgi:hypothetical protein